MKLLKPTFVNNQEKPIFSIDIHPKEPKFVTGGQGNDSGSVTIWNLQPVLSEEAELDPKVPKILCQIDNHLSCVNAVRWSKSGQYLASGADDKLVMIWKQFPGSSSTFGTSVKNVENWRCVATLRGHSGDILDIAWSPQDRWIASCSVDNSVIIWDAMSFPTIVSTLKGHTGLVKGVAWDPVGKYLASQSDDKTVKIWKTSDWTLNKTITEPFDECGGTTHVLRLSWSPDGQYLVSAHAMNGGGPTAQIIERDGWTCDKDFVGHRKAVTCVRFHNSIFKRQSPKTNKTQQYCCLAIGSRDRCLSVWMTALQRPLLVIRELFDDTILDLSWSNDGYVLLACSGDGTIACLQFNEDQLGRPLTEDDKNSLYQRMYGKDATIDLSSQTDKELIVENAELLYTLTQEKPKGPPTLIPTVEAPPQKIQQQVTAPVASAAVSPGKPILKQVETRRADGKRRITPMFIPLTSTAPPVEFGSSSQGSTSTQDPVPVRVEEKAPAPPLNEPLKLDTRLTFRDTPQKAQGTLVSNSLASPAPVTPKPVVPYVRITSGKAQPLVGAQCAKIVTDYRIQALNEAYKTSFGNLSRVVSSHVTPPASGDRKVWEVLVGSPVSSLSVCGKYTIVGAMDGSVRIMQIDSGKLIVPILSQSSPILLSGFSPNSKYGGILTESSQLSIWNLHDVKIHFRTSCIDILNGSGFINIFHITNEGVPFICTSLGSAYSYSVDLQSWMLVNSSDSLSKCGLNGLITNVKDMKTYPVSTMQFLSNSFQQRSKTAVEISDAPWDAQSKISQIEHQIKLCETIKSSSELKHWYSCLGYYLSLHGSEKQIRQLLDELLGPIYSLQNDATFREKHKILNIDKHEILDEMLTHFRRSTKWQRIYSEYFDQLSELRKAVEAQKMDAD